MIKACARNQSSQIYADYTISRIDRETRSSLSDRQLNAFRDAIIASQSGSRHQIDCRFTVPLFLARFYVVLLIGRDRRKQTRLQEMRRNQWGNVQLAPVLSFLLISLLISLLWFALFLAMYWLKRELGIDLLENFHLADLLPAGQSNE